MKRKSEDVQNTRANAARKAIISLKRRGLPLLEACAVKRQCYLSFPKMSIELLALIRLKARERAVKARQSSQTEEALSLRRCRSRMREAILQKWKLSMQERFRKMFSIVKSQQRQYEKQGYSTTSIPNWVAAGFVVSV